ncbi:MAG: MFS transporter [Alistipes sp.]|nr:MFS transporter [Candidatus Minthomonas equi]
MKPRLSIMIFLQFAILGSYITSMGGYLASIGLAGHIGYFYAIGGFISLFVPALMGILADTKIASQRLYGYLHLFLAVFLCVFGFYCSSGAITGVNVIWSLLLYAMIPISVIPTIPLAYSTIFAVLKQNGMDSGKEFPRIRVFGTVGFIFSMLAVDLLGVQHSHLQFFVGAFFAFILSGWSFVIPDCPPAGRAGNGAGSSVKLFKSRPLAIFFALSLCFGMLEKISEAYTNPFLASLDVSHPNAILSISRVAEVVGILLIPPMLRYFGIKKTLAVSLFSRIVYYGCLAFGSSNGSIWPLVASMISYGSAFSFFSIAGSIFVENRVEPSFRSTAQGTMSVMTNGFGAIAGSMAAQWLFDSLIPSSSSWSGMWWVLTAFSAVLSVLFILIFKPGSTSAGK